MINREQLNSDYYEALRELDTQPDQLQASRTTNILLVQVREVLLDIRDLLASIDRRIDS